MAGVEQTAGDPAAHPTEPDDGDAHQVRVIADTRNVLRSWSNRVAAWVWIGVCVFFLGFGTHLVWGSVVSRPRTYAHLRAVGVPASALLAACGHFGGGRGITCRLRLSFAGRTRTWTYANDTHQFHGVPIGAPIPVLVDPEHPSTVYTVHDVQAGTNAGWGVLAFFGVVLVIAGAAGLACYWLFIGRLRRLLRARYA